MISIYFHKFPVVMQKGTEPNGRQIQKRRFKVYGLLLPQFSSFAPCFKASYEKVSTKIAQKQSKFIGNKCYAVTAQAIYFNRPFDKSRLKKMILWSLSYYGHKKTIDFIETLKNVGYMYSTKAGISIGIDDLTIPPIKKQFLNQTKADLFSDYQQRQKGYYSQLEYAARLLYAWNATNQYLKREVIAHFKQTDTLNPVFMMSFSGARGNIAQVRQLVGMRGLMTDLRGRVVNYAIQTNFREGLTLTEYVISCYGARKGVIDTALRTATSGYLTRRLVDVAQHVVILQMDCGTHRGIYLNPISDGQKIMVSLKTRLFGRTLAQSVWDPVSKKQIAAKNQVITAQLAEQFVTNKIQVLIRSPLTCKLRKQVCRYCYGWDLSCNKLVHIGEAVGVIAGQSIGEPGTQLTMRTFHTGGVFSTEVEDKYRCPFSAMASFDAATPGKIVRNLTGDVGFLVKQLCQFTLTPIDSSMPSKTYLLLPYTVVFAKHLQPINAFDLLLEEPPKLHESKKTMDMFETVYSNISGQLKIKAGTNITKYHKRRGYRYWLAPASGLVSIYYSENRKKKIIGVYKTTAYPPFDQGKRDQLLKQKRVSTGVLPYDQFDFPKFSRTSTRRPIAQSEQIKLKKYQRRPKDIFFTTLKLNEFWLFALTPQIIYNQNLRLFIRKGDYIESKAPIAKYISLSHVLNQHQSFDEIFNGFNTTCFKKTNYLNFDVPSVFPSPVPNKLPQGSSDQAPNKDFFISKPRPNTRFEVSPTVKIRQKAYETANFTSAPFEKTRNTYFFQKWQSKNAYHGLTQTLQTSSNFNRTLRLFEKHSQHHIFTFMCDKKSIFLKKKQTFASLLLTKKQGGRRKAEGGRRIGHHFKSNTFLENSTTEFFKQKRLKNKLIPINLKLIQLKAITSKNFSGTSKHNKSIPPTATVISEVTSVKQITKIPYGFLHLNHIKLQHSSFQVNWSRWFANIPRLYLYYWRNTSFCHSYWMNSLEQIFTYYALYTQDMSWVNAVEYASWTKYGQNISNYRQPDQTEQKAIASQHVQKSFCPLSPLDARATKLGLYNLKKRNPAPGFLFFKYSREHIFGSIPLLTQKWPTVYSQLWNKWTKRQTSSASKKIQGFFDPYIKTESNKTDSKLYPNISIFQYFYPSHINSTKHMTYNITLPLDCKAYRSFYIKSVKRLVKTRKFLFKTNPKAFVLTSQSQIHSVWTSKKPLKSAFRKKKPPSAFRLPTSEKKNRLPFTEVKVLPQQKLAMQPFLQPERGNKGQTQNAAELKHNVVLLQAKKRGRPKKQQVQQTEPELLLSRIVSQKKQNSEITQTQGLKEDLPDLPFATQNIENDNQSQVKKRGRPRKQVQVQTVPGVQTDNQNQVKKRGRPRKQVQVQTVPGVQTDNQSQVKKRGRPRKQVHLQTVSPAFADAKLLLTQNFYRSKRKAEGRRRKSDGGSRKSEGGRRPQSLSLCKAQNQAKNNANKSHIFADAKVGRILGTSGVLNLKSFFFNQGFLVTQYQSNMLFNYHVFNQNVTLIFLWFFVLKKVYGFLSKVTYLYSKPSNLLEQTLKQIQPCTSFLVCDSLKPHIALTELINQRQSYDYSSLTVAQFFYFLSEKQKANFSCLIIPSVYKVYLNKHNKVTTNSHSSQTFVSSPCVFRNLLRFKANKDQKLRKHKPSERRNSAKQRATNHNNIGQKDPNKKTVTSFTNRILNQNFVFNLSKHKLQQKLNLSSKYLNLPLINFLPNGLTRFLKPSSIKSDKWIQDFVFKGSITLFPKGLPNKHYERFEQLFLCLSKETKFSVFYNPLKNKITRLKPFNHSVSKRCLNIISCDKYLLPKPIYSQPYIKAGVCNSFSNTNTCSRFVTNQISKYYLTKLKKLVGHRQNEITIPVDLLMLPIWQTFPLSFALTFTWNEARATRKKQSTKQTKNKLFHKGFSEQRQSSTENTQFFFHPRFAPLKQIAQKQDKYDVFLRYKQKNWFSTMFQTQWRYALDAKHQEKNPTLSLKPLLLKQNKHKKFRNSFSNRYFSLCDSFSTLVSNRKRSIKQLKNNQNKQNQQNQPTNIQLNSFFDYFIQKEIPKKFQDKMQYYFLLKKNLLNTECLVYSNSLHRFTGFDHHLNFKHNWISLYTQLNQSLRSDQRLVIPAYDLSLHVGFDQPVCLNKCILKFKVPQILNSYDWWILTPFDHVENGVFFASNSKGKAKKAHFRFHLSSKEVLKFADFNQKHGLDLLNKPHFYPIFCRSVMKTLYQINLDSLFFDKQNIIITEEFGINKKAQQHFNELFGSIFKNFTNPSIRKQTIKKMQLFSFVKKQRQNNLKKLHNKHILLVFLYFYYQNISLVPLLSMGRQKLLPLVGATLYQKKTSAQGTKQSSKGRSIHLTGLETNKIQSCFQRCCDCFGFKITSKPNIQSKNKKKQFGQNKRIDQCKSNVIQSYVRLILFKTMQLPLKMIPGSINYTMGSIEPTTFAYAKVPQFFHTKKQRTQGALSVRDKVLRTKFLLTQKEDERRKAEGGRRKTEGGRRAKDYFFMNKPFYRICSFKKTNKHQTHCEYRMFLMHTANMHVNLYTRYQPKLLIESFQPALATDKIKSINLSALLLRTQNFYRSKTFTEVKGGPLVRRTLSSSDKASFVFSYGKTFGAQFFHTKKQREQKGTAEGGQWTAEGGRRTAHKNKITKKQKLRSMKDNKQTFNKGFQLHYYPVALRIWQKSQQMHFSTSTVSTNPVLNPIFKPISLVASLNQTFRQHIFQNIYLNNHPIFNHQIAHQKLLERVPSSPVSTTFASAKVDNASAQAFVFNYNKSAQLPFLKQGVKVVTNISETQHQSLPTWNQTPLTNLLINNCWSNYTTNEKVQGANTGLSHKHYNSGHSVTPMRLSLKKQRLYKSYVSMSESDYVDANFVDELTVFTAFLYSKLVHYKNKNKKIQRGYYDFNKPKTNTFTKPKQWLKMNIKHQSLKLPHILSCLDHYYDLYEKLDLIKRGTRFFVYTAIRNHPVSTTAALDIVNNQKPVIPFLFPYGSKGLLFFKQNYFVHRGFPYVFTLHLDYNNSDNWIKQQCYFIADKPRLVLFKTSQLFKRQYLHQHIRKVSTMYIDFNKNINLNKPCHNKQQTMIKQISSRSTGEVIAIKPNNPSESNKQEAYHETNEFLDVHCFNTNDVITYSINAKSIAKLKLGTIFYSNQDIIPGLIITQSGQLVFLTERTITLRKIQMNLITKAGLFNFKNNTLIQLHTPLAILNYKGQIKEDFLQGISKLEQLFEARRNLVTGLSVRSVLLSSFLSFRGAGYNIKHAVRHSMHFIQQYLVNAIQIVYQNQGINIADKHLEVIVKQMTSKAVIVKSGTTGLLVGDIVFLDLIERANSSFAMITHNSISADYRPLVLGLTKASLTTQGFLSAASFQETIRVLSKAALFNKRDFLAGLKENVICGNFIPAGTGVDYVSLAVHPNRINRIQYHRNLQTYF